MSGVNKTITVGYLSKDPEVHGAVTRLSIPTSEKWKDKQTGEDKERTEWNNVTCFGKIAEIAAKYLHKGSQVYIEGQLRTDKFQDKNTGEDRYSTSIVANKLEMLGKAGSKDSAPQSSGGSQDFDENVPF